MAKRLFGNSGTVVAALAFILTVAAGLLLLWPGTITGETCSSGSAGESCHEVTVWDEEGQGGLILFWSALMVASTALPLAFRSMRVRLGVGLWMLAFSILGSMTIGLAFAPAALVMLVASALPPYRRQATS